MSSKSRSMRRAKKRIDGLGVDRESMTHVLMSLSQKIKDQGNLIHEMEILLQEHEEKLEALLDHLIKKTDEDPTEKG